MVTVSMSPRAPNVSWMPSMTAFSSAPSAKLAKYWMIDVLIAPSSSLPKTALAGITSVSPVASAIKALPMGKLSPRSSV